MRIQIEKIQVAHMQAEYTVQIGNLAYKTYIKACQVISDIGGLSREALSKGILDMLQSADGYVAISNERVMGYMFGYKWGEENYYIPLGGLCVVEGPERGKIISLLFEKYADEMGGKGTHRFEITVFAHDDEMIRKLGLLQFGIEAEKGIYRPSHIPAQKFSDVHITRLSKEEVLSRWQEVWHLISAIITRLGESPIFYSGDGFTEEGYKTFLTDENTHVFVASDKKEYVGIIETKGSRRFMHPAFKAS